MPEHVGHRVAVVRVLRVVEWDPVRPNPTYTGPQLRPEFYPREGYLLVKMSLSKPPRVWAVDIDKTVNSDNGKNVAQGLGVLFDNALQYGGY